MMEEIEDLKQQLKELQAKRESDTNIKKLKKQIKMEKFAQTKSGKVFHKIADIGQATSRYLSKPAQRPSGSGKGKKKKTPARLSVEEIMAKLPK